MAGGPNLGHCRSADAKSLTRRAAVEWCAMPKRWTDNDLSIWILKLPVTRLLALKLYYLAAGRGRGWNTGQEMGDISKLPEASLKPFKLAVPHPDIDRVWKQETPLASVWMRFSFKSYWHRIQWPCNLRQSVRASDRSCKASWLIGPMRDVGRRGILSPACEHAARRDLPGFTPSQINYSPQSN